MEVHVFEDNGDIFVYEMGSRVVYEMKVSHEMDTWGHLAAAIQSHRGKNTQKWVSLSLVKQVHAYEQLLERLALVKSTAMWNGETLELKQEPGPAAQQFLSTMLPQPVQAKCLMKFRVSIEVPGDPLKLPKKKGQQFCEEVLQPFEGHYVDCMLWGTGGEDSYMLWFESQKPDLAATLHEALVAGMIWSYTIRVCKQKGQTEQEARASQQQPAE